MSVEVLKRIAIIVWFLAGGIALVFAVLIGPDSFPLSVRSDHSTVYLTKLFELVDQIGRTVTEQDFRTRPVTGFTLALHEGEVLSGNVGSQDRLDFTVVGPAVNEVHRISAMSRSLDQPILVSATFAAACGNQRERLVSLGRYVLRGVSRPQELFTVDLSGPEPSHSHL